jgi:hypothetical protein
MSGRRFFGRHPVLTRHPHNANLQNWWIGLPGRTPGDLIPDIVRGHHANVRTGHSNQVAWTAGGYGISGLETFGPDVNQQFRAPGAFTEQYPYAATGKASCAGAFWWHPRIWPQGSQGYTGTPVEHGPTGGPASHFPWTDGTVYLCMFGTQRTAFTSQFPPDPTSTSSTPSAPARCSAEVAAITLTGLTTGTSSGWARPCPTRTRWLEKIFTTTAAGIEIY